MRNPRLLICGFGPFPGAPDNPTALAVQRLEKEKWAPALSRTAFALLPTVWSGAPDLALKAAEAAGADAILLTGVALGSPYFRVETLAGNSVCTDRPDAEGALWPSPVIDADGPEQRPATAASRPLIDILAARRLPAVLSNDAGDYLCNFTFYRVLAQARVPVAFLHVPPVDMRMRLDLIVNGIQAVAWALAEQMV